MIVNQKDITQLIKIDKTLEFINDKYGIPPNWERTQGFISLSRIILGQQLSLASADAHFIKLSSYIAEFTPTNILALTDAEMRTCQISRQKMVYLRSLSSAIINGDIDLYGLNQINEKEIRKQLTGIKGIGDWTADIYLMFCMQSKDILPIGDVAIINTIKELYGLTTKEEILHLSEKWRPYRSLAAYFLWHYYLNKRNRSGQASII